VGVPCPQILAAFARRHGNPQNASEQRADRDYKVTMTRFFCEGFGPELRRISAAVLGDIAKKRAPESRCLSHIAMKVIGASMSIAYYNETDRSLPYLQARGDAPR
jgi:hypothetical protein